jgi:hypothetical protein
MTDIKANGNVAYAAGKGSIAAGRDVIVNIHKDTNPEYVSYSIFEIDHLKPEESIQQIADLMDIKLTEDQRNLPFISPIGIQDYEDACKLIVYGVRGCGKSRCILEMIKQKVATLQRIIIVSPRSTSPIRSDRKSLSELVNDVIQQEDLVIWDNFPEGLQGQMLNYRFNALKELTSSKLNNLLISLKSEYNELYIDEIRTIPELFIFDIRYSETEIQQIVESYGKYILQFKNAYFDLVKDNVVEISIILNNREPTPSAIYLYYKQLIQEYKEKKLTKQDILMLASEFKLPANYYKSQFDKYIRKERPQQASFLYTLKLSYDLGLPPTPTVLEKLQRTIFNTDPLNDPLQSLSTWIDFSSGKYYTLPNVARSAIDYPADLKKIMIDRLTIMFDELTRTNENTTYLFGVFFGENVSSLEYDIRHYFLPENIYTFLKNHKNFSAGYADGIGKCFLSLNSILQEDIVKMTRDNEEQEDDDDYLGFSVRLGGHLGILISSVSENLRKMILESLNQETNFAKGLGFGVGTIFSEIDKELQNFVLDKLDNDEILNFQKGFSNAIRYIFTTTNQELQNFVLNKISQNTQFSLILGSSIGFLLFSKMEPGMAYVLIQRNDWVSWGLGYRCGIRIREFEKSLQESLWQMTDRGHNFAEGFGFGISCTLEDVLINDGHNHLENKIWKVAETNRKFCDGLCQGIAIAFSSLSMRIKVIIWNKTYEQSNFSEALGFFIANMITSLSIENQYEILAELKDNRFGQVLITKLGILYETQMDEIKEVIWEIAQEYEQLAFCFAKGLAASKFTGEFKQIEKDLQHKIQKVSSENESFKKGLAAGLQEASQQSHNDLPSVKR